MAGPASRYLFYDDLYLRGTPMGTHVSDLGKIFTNTYINTEPNTESSSFFLFLFLKEAAGHNLMGKEMIMM